MQLAWFRRVRPTPDAAQAPEPPLAPDDEFAAQVRRVLAEFQPYLNADGGAAELVRIGENGDVHIRLRGACAGCPQSSVTFDLTLEQRLREVAPKFRRLIRIEC